VIVLPWPPASLSGHNNGHWRAKARIVATHRSWAFHATRAAKVNKLISDDGDICIHVRFVPPDRRGDRTNYPNRLKPYFDGIAEALNVNDRRFLPSFEFAAPEKPGRVEVFIPNLGHLAHDLPSQWDSEGCKKSGLGDAETSTKPLTNSLNRSEADDA
jgi:hypothetical protein